jgi:hypothetical protein
VRKQPAVSEKQFARIAS